MSTQPEAKFKNKLVDAFSSVFPEGFCVKLVSGMMQAGLPDLYFAAASRSGWLEAKVDGNGLRGPQTKVLPRMAQAGVPVWVISTRMGDKEAIRKVTLTRVHDGYVRVVSWPVLWSQPFWDSVLG